MVVDVIHGQSIPDPFRRLEDAADHETQTWCATQDRLFAEARDGWPDRGDMQARLEKLYRVGAVGAPVWRGDRSFALRRSPEQDHAALVVTEPSGAERVLVDPGALDP